MAWARKEAGDSCLVSGRESSRIISVSVKTPQDCQEFMLAENSSIRHFKNQISKRLHCDTGQLVLIFTGKILRDQDILSQRGILDGTTVRLVVRTHVKGAVPISRTRPDPTGHGTQRSEPSTSESAGMVAKPGRLVRSSPVLADFFGQLAQLLMAVPEPVVQVLEDSLVQGLASKNTANTSHVPESSRPVRKPEPGPKAPDIWETPGEQEESLQADKQGLEALKSEPGGDNAVRAVCSDIQQLMLSALAPLVASGGPNPGSEFCKEEVNAHRRTDTTTAIPTASAPARPLPQEVSVGVATQTGSMALTQANSGCRTGILNSYSGQDRSSQDGQLPIGKTTPASQLRPSASALHRTLHLLQQNLSQQHQMAPGSPARYHIPLLSILTNPKALQALMQVEKGLQILSREVPGLEPCLGGPARPHGAAGGPETRGAGRGHRIHPVQPTMAILQLLHALAKACPQSTHSSLSTARLTENSHQQELEQPKATGFGNCEANLQDLIAIGGDICAAIERLLGGSDA